VADAPVTWLEVGLLWLACLLAGGLAGALWDIRRLHAKIWDRWVVEGDLRHQLAIARAKASHAEAAYLRRVDRWRAYATDLQAFAVREGLLAAWRAEADQLAMPWVDSTFSDPA